MEYKLESEILFEVAQNASIESSLEYSTIKASDHAKLIGVLKSLESDGVLQLIQKENKYLEVSSEGKEILKRGSPEFIVSELIPLNEEGITIDDLKEIGKLSDSDLKIGLQYCHLNKWVAQKEKRLVRTQNDIKDKVRILLTDFERKEHLPEDSIEILKKRKLIEQVTQKFYRVEKGINFTTTPQKKLADLTAKLISGDSWQKSEFKKYNFNSLGKEISLTGDLHPLLKVKSQFQEILLSMGFEEMPTNNYVESSFWNFDTLFVPQQHPARDVQDTFFILEPSKATIEDKEYFQIVGDTHIKGIEKSIGWRYPWSAEEARKNVLRTHTTAVTARILRELAKQKTFTPRKFFSIDRVFRNENLDATHLAEFHQIEGWVADYNIGLKQLKGVITAFFRKIGLENLKFKPAYNPYTEPSMEIFAFHPLLGRWVEVGNSGVFRPEMLIPMGIPADISIIAWGLSLERPTMIQYGCSNIRNLFGSKVDFKYVKSNPLCCLVEQSEKQIRKLL